MAKLPRLGDVARFMDESFRNEVYLITEDECIKCNGVVLAARCGVLESMIQASENVPVIEFSDNLPGLYSCINLLYGRTEVINKYNYRSVFKFGKIFQIEPMMNVVVQWVDIEVPINMFWEVCWDIMKLDMQIALASFKGTIKRHLLSDFDDFLLNAIRICQHGCEKTLKGVLKLLLDVDFILNESMLIFLLDLLNGSTDVEEIPGTSMSKYTDTVVSCVVDFLESSMTPPNYYLPNGFCRNYIEVLKKLCSVCNSVEVFRRIAKLQNNINAMALFAKEMALSTTNILTWEIVAKLSNPNTSHGTIRYFAEHVGGQIHPCITGEIILKWWKEVAFRNPDSEPDTTFIKVLFTKIHNFYSYWVHSVCFDAMYTKMVKALRISDPPQERSLCYYCSRTNQSLRKLTQCITLGTGNSLILPEEDMRSLGMNEHKNNIPAFRYNPAEVPPYGRVDGHWFMVSCSKINEKYHLYFLSFLTDTQEKILRYLDSNTCRNVTLCFVPLP